MVQATILDLIDRSHLTYRQEGDSNILTRIEKEGSLHLKCLSWICCLMVAWKLEIRKCSRAIILIKMALEKQFKSARTSYEREAIRSQGKRVKYQFTNDGYQVAKGVEKRNLRLDFLTFIEILVRKKDI